MKNKIKALCLSAVIIFSVFSMTACGEVNYMEKYKNYLDYSLGDWSLADSDVQIKDKKKVTKWKVVFNDFNGNQLKYNFTNQTDVNHDNNFGSTIAYIASDIADKDLESKILKNRLKDDEIGNELYKSNSSGFSGGVVVFDFECMQNESKTTKYVKSIISPSDGIKLSDLTADKYFADKPRFAYYLFSTNSDNKSEIEAMQTRIDQIVSDTQELMGGKVNVLAVLKQEDEYGDLLPVYSKAFIQDKEIIFDFDAEENKDLNPSSNYNLKISEHYNIVLG